MSMSPILESLILQGLARYDTWTFGGAGAGTLRLDKKSFIIVTDFDYFYFVDAPVGVEANPASAYSNLNVTDDSATTSFTYEIPGLGTAGPIEFDPADPVASCESFEAAIMDAFGFFANCEYTETNIWQMLVITNAPGTGYNTLVPVFDISTVSEYALSPGEFQGGADEVPATPQQMNAASVHQLEFRQKGINYAWVIRENLSLVPQADGDPAYGNVNGVFQKTGLYIPFSQDVQIDIAHVPEVSDWTIEYKTLDTKSNEPSAPAGYGTTGTPGALDVVYQILFDGVDEQYLPVTKDRSDATLERYREQFRPDYRPSRALNDPQINNENNGAGQTYPILNIGFVRVDMDWKDFQQHMKPILEPHLWTRKK